MISEKSRFCECFVMSCSKFFPKPNVCRESLCRATCPCRCVDECWQSQGSFSQAPHQPVQASWGCKQSNHIWCDARSEPTNQVSIYPTRSASSTPLCPYTQFNPKAGRCLFSLEAHISLRAGISAGLGMGGEQEGLQ